MPRQARLASLQAKLEVDQRLLRQVNQGYTVLNDALDWISTQKKLKIARQAREAVQEHQEFYIPIMEVDDCTNMPGSLQSLTSKLPLPKKPDASCNLSDAQSKTLIAFVLDSNVPGATRLT